jgi:hypothetical protein
MNVLVTGLNHQIQRAEILSGGDEIERLEREQKTRFADYIARIIEDRRIGFIGEEAQHGVTLIAQRVASDFNRRHRNIEMAPDIRKVLQIPNDYTRLDRPYSDEQRAFWHRKREEHMFDEVIQNAACDRVLVLCGREHIMALGSRLQASGHEVETYDLNREVWYVEDWLLHVLNS